MTLIKAPFRFAALILSLIALQGLSGCESFRDSVYRAGMVSAVSASLTNLPPAIRGGEPLNISFKIDTGSAEASSIRLEYSEDGSNYTLLSSLTATDTHYTWNVPSVNTLSSRLRIVTVNAGTNETVTTESSPFVIDSIAPNAPVITRTSSSLSKSRVVQASVSSCADTSAIFLSESNSPPSLTDSGWQPCSTTSGAASFNVSSGDGTKTIYAFARDLAGNISSVSNSISMTLDQTRPAAPSVTLNSSSLTNLTAVTLTASNCTDTTALLVTESNTSPSETAPSWQTCSTAAGAISYTLATSTVETKSLKVWSKDAAGNISSTATGISVVFDNEVPNIRSITINDGNSYTGTPFVLLKVDIQKTLSTPVKVHFVEANNITGDCNTEYNTNTTWQDWFSSSQTFSFTFSNSDGQKKVCVWAKDSVGNTSVQTPSTGTNGVTTASINYMVGSPPTITAFDVYNPDDHSRVYTIGHTNVNIDWNANSTVGLAANPISISYMTSTDTTYRDIVTNLDASVGDNVTWLGNVTSGAHSASDSYTAFTAPTGLFRIRVKAKDIAGNISIAVISDLQNGGQWSVYAGTTDRGLGGAGKSAVLTAPQSMQLPVALNPLNNDIYAVDNGTGIQKLDARTGLTSTFIASGTNDLMTGTNGKLPTVPHYGVGSSTRILFDSNGLLYLTSANATNSSTLYQINPQTRDVKIYLPGGNQIGTIASPPSISTANFPGGIMTFDEDNSLYYVMNCIPGSQYDTSGRQHRLVKVTQDPSTHEPASLSIVGGTCTTPASATTSSGSPATSIALPALIYINLGSMAVWERGKYIYVYSHSDPNLNYKILNGVIYPSVTTAAAGLLYQASTGKMVVTNGNVRLMTPNLSGANGDVFDSSPVVASNGTGDCTIDDISPSNACAAAWHNVVQNNQGQLFFADGSGINALTAYRIRYVSKDSKMKTLFGSLPFYGDGLKASLARGTFAGIFYKTSTQGTLANRASTAFPEGLYFVEQKGPVFGYIDPSSKIIKVLWGNQSNQPFSNGDTASVTLSMNNPYALRNGRELTFDSTGLPWMAANKEIWSLSATHQLMARTETSTPATSYVTILDNANITNLAIHLDGFENNLQIGSDGLAFTLGAYTSSYTGVSLKALNYSAIDVGSVKAGKVYGVMGTNTTVGASLDSALDTPTPVSVKNKTFSTNCHSGGCKTVYREDEHRLYFSEDSKIRYITHPETPATATLATLFTAAGTLGNFVFSNDKATLYYLRGGRLYCRNLTSSRSECTDTQTLGPPTGTSAIVSGPNQFTWKDDRTLLISDYRGTIYQYEVP